MNKYNGGGGYLYNRLRYLRHKERDKCKNTLQTVNETEEPTSSAENETVASNSQDAMNNDTETSESYQMDDLLFLKTIIVNEGNMPKIFETLRKTLQRRRELLETENVNMLEQFPIMFVHPPFVS